VAELAVLLRPPAAPSTEEIAAARAAVEAARRKLVKLLSPPSPADVTAARLELERARAELRALEAGPSHAALAAAREAVYFARARLAQLFGPSLRTDITAARLDLRRAQADLAVLRARGGPGSWIDVAFARLKVRAARAQLASARFAERLLTVRAPSDGTVTALLTVNGAPVDVSTPIVAVNGLDRLGVSVDLSEFDVARVRRGMRAVVSVDALGGKSFPAKVLFAALTGNDNGGTVTFPVRLGLTRAAGLRPGMNVSVRIIVAERHDVVQVPVEAVSHDAEDRPFATVISGSGDTSTRKLELGLANNKSVEVESGLRDGERVVLAASQDEGGEEG
jgi:HlyD family secretion protein